MQKGMIFDIQRFSLHDGPGIRTTVFLKGCPLRCIWCHNPEGYKPYAQLSYNPALCGYCGACAAACPRQAHSVSGESHAFSREKCAGCGACTAVCLNNALELIGREQTVEDVINVVMKDLPFYRTGDGGMTLSGGEPMAQPDFATELAKEAKSRGLHVCVETSGFCATQALIEISKFVDLFLYDIKETDEAAHARLTGVGFELIRQNLFALDAAGAKTILRCPLVPGCNMRDEHYTGIAELANKLKHVVRIELEPYHSIGVNKGAHLGIEQPTFETMSPADIKKASDIIGAKTDIPILAPNKESP